MVEAHPGPCLEMSDVLSMGSAAAFLCVIDVCFLNVQTTAESDMQLFMT